MVAQFFCANPSLSKCLREKENISSATGCLVVGFKFGRQRDAFML